MNEATHHKREALTTYIEREIVPETCIKAVMVTGSVAKGTARMDSDIDAVVFMTPLDMYAVPGEAQYDPVTGTYHSIFDSVNTLLQLDFKRVDLKAWSMPEYDWPEPVRAELSAGWLAFDRSGQVAKLIAERTLYDDTTRQNKLDKALSHIDWLLNENQVEHTWDTLGPETAHYRLHSAFNALIDGLFAYNRRWRPFQGRGITDLLSLAWLPDDFQADLLQATNALSKSKESYLHRASLLQRYHRELVMRCQQHGLYGKAPEGQVFIRMNQQPGKAWNMDTWNIRHRQRRESCR